MSRNASGSTVVLGLFAVLLVALAPLAEGGEQKDQLNFGSVFFDVNPPCPAKKAFPDFEVLVPIPAIIDPFDQDSVSIFCEIQTRSEGVPVKAVKGRYTNELIVRDNNTGNLEVFPVGSDRFRTNRNGRDGFDFELPSELFADGFESGDVSAWSYTRADFTNKKRVTNGSLQCGKQTNNN